MSYNTIRVPLALRIAIRSMAAKRNVSATDQVRDILKDYKPAPMERDNDADAWGWLRISTADQRTVRLQAAELDVWMHNVLAQALEQYTWPQ